MVKVATDSVADLPDELLNQFGIHMIPGLVHFDTATYQSNALDPQRFYQLLELIWYHP